MKHPLISLLFIATGALAQLADQATPADKVTISKGFKVELLYSVPKEQEGSWVSMTQDDKGRMICSDQYGALYRITPPALTGSPGETKVEKLSIDFGHCQGLLFHAGALYGVVNDNAYQGRGLYRCKDTNGDDQFDTVELLRSFPGKAGEHGPHGVIASPDGKSLYVMCGNQTPEPNCETSLVPRHWAEDQLYPMLTGRGFMRDVLAPGGWLAKTDLDGKKWELVNIGTRNTYDIAMNRSGDIFGFDADMEWDTGMPWYRPTRVCFMQSGGDFGWRTCSKKFPMRWEDSLPAVVDIGPGSPTGVAFGYGAKFPAKYQDALFICDWSYGKMYAVHLSPNGGGYTGVTEEFMSGAPLPLTDIEVSKKDGAMYVSVGGRKVQSGLYRVTYVGGELGSWDSTQHADSGNHNRTADVRRGLEAFLGKQDAEAVDRAWLNLGHADRNMRFAARIALEHQPLASWKDKALTETNPRAALSALMALARSSGGDKALQKPVLAALNKINFKALKGIDRVTLIRDYMLAFTRMGEPDAATKESLIKHLSPLFPTNDPALNRDLCEVLVYLGDEGIVAKAEPLVNGSPTQEEQIDYARILRFAKSGWTKELRADYFRWFLRAANYKGGASFDLFIGEIKQNALSTMTEEEKLAIKDVLDSKPEAKAPSFTVKPMQFVKAWTLAELSKSLGVGLEGNRNFANGRNMFGAATCFACHRFNNEGGAVGPDLTSVAGKYSPRDLLEHILEPSKEISDQYGSTVFTLQDGSTVIGRIANMNENNMMVCTNMMDPNNFTNVDSRKVVKTEESKISMMPPGLLFMLKEDDILDLMAYLLSKGNPDDPMFVK
ncbi:c-type cytochrome [Prosthecobacter sp.]|uniref:c-type cytochrome n=1 Tax=Prosthecobacter sp. TaxID=1965333 RepID=UPI002487B707|nr:c-type cytochrome [Prosthecobacter sp.]MDI1313069.1 c-type cytochrome [Prosthecobacter sp.]